MKITLTIRKNDAGQRLDKFLTKTYPNLFTASVILICGIGGMAMAIGKVTITAIACALILGIVVNRMLNKASK